MSAVAPDPELVRRHILMILAMPRTRVRHSRISQRVLYAAACAGSLYFGRDDELLRRSEEAFRWCQFMYDVSLSRELGWCDEQKAHRDESDWSLDRASHLAALLENAHDSDVERFTERCEMCGERLGWAGPHKSRCLRGHVFGKSPRVHCSLPDNADVLLRQDRCHLTFLSIQSPGQSRFCGICSKQYLKETVVGNESVITDNPWEGLNLSAASIARILLAACDVCVYCGGKFTG
jgi:hypothetical protein